MLWVGFLFSDIIIILHKNLITRGSYNKKTVLVHKIFEQIAYFKIIFLLMFLKNGM